MISGLRNTFIDSIGRPGKWLDKHRLLGSSREEEYWPWHPESFTYFIPQAAATNYLSFLCLPAACILDFCSLYPCLLFAAAITKVCASRHSQHEMDFWLGLSQTESKASTALTLVVVNTCPSLQLIPPLIKVPPGTTSAFYSTPVSTPQPHSIVSPEQTSAPVTPVNTTTPANPTTPGGTPGTARERDEKDPLASNLG